MKYNKQKGLGMIGLILNLAILGFVVVYAIQIGIVYINKNTIEKTVVSTLLEYKSIDKPEAKDIKEAIIKKIEINNIDVANEDVIVVRDNEGFNVQVRYHKEVGINDDLSINMDFLIDEYTP